MTLSRIGFAILCVSLAVVIGWFHVKAFRRGRKAYGHVGDRTLHVDRDKHPRLFWLAFIPGLFFCIGLIDLAIRGPAVLSP
jgi:hypothetical protein